MPIIQRPSRNTEISHHTGKNLRMAEADAASVASGVRKTHEHNMSYARLRKEGIERFVITWVRGRARARRASSLPAWTCARTQEQDKETKSHDSCWSLHDQSLIKSRVLKAVRLGRNPTKDIIMSKRKVYLFNTYQKGHTIKGTYKWASKSKNNQCNVLLWLL